MENSYRALMIAGGVLLGILLLSAFVYMFRSGARFNRSVEESQIEQQRIAENNKFEQYNRNNNKISDMVSLINLVYDFNQKKDFEETESIDLLITIGSVKYSIPNKTTPVSSNLKRNMVIKNDNEIVSTYDLLSKTLQELGISSIPNTGSISADNKDKLIITKYDKTNTSTVYKYLFIAKQFTYNPKTGYIRKMQFEVKINDEWN